MKYAHQSVFYSILRHFTFNFQAIDIFYIEHINNLLTISGNSCRINLQAKLNKMIGDLI